MTTAVSWCQARRAAVPAGYPPVIYCNRDTLTPLFNAMDAAGLQVVQDFRLLMAAVRAELGGRSGLAAAAGENTC